MSTTIKKGVIKYKNPTNGNYVEFNGALQTVQNVNKFS